MTLHTLLIILVSILIVIGFTGIVVLTYILGRASIKDNPQLALVFVKTGNHITNPFKAKLHETSKKGYCFKFLYKKAFVFIPKTYHMIFYKNKRMIFLSRDGQLIASPFDKDIMIKDAESTNLIYELCETHVGADSIRALSGKTILNTIIIAIISFAIGAILVFGYTQFQANQAKNSVSQTQTQTQQKTNNNLPTPIEVK